MQYSFNILTVGPVGSPLEDLHIFCIKSKTIRFVSHVESISQALKKLNYSAQIHIVICDLRYSLKDLQYFFRATSETLYGGYCCYFGLLHYTDDEVSDDLKVRLPFHGFLSSPFNKESKSDLEILVDNARKILQDKPVIQWLESVAERLLVQVDILVELKKAGYYRENFDNDLLSISKRIRGLHPRFLLKWEEILLAFAEEKEKSNVPVVDKHYTEASSSVAKIITEKNALVSKESSQFQNQNFTSSDSSEFQNSEILPDFDEFPMPTHPSLKPSNSSNGGRPMLRSIMNKTRSDI
jgi:hypothetical protein